MTGEQASTEYSPMHKPQSAHSPKARLGSEDKRPENSPPVGPAAQSCKNPPNTLSPATRTSETSLRITSPSLANRRDLQTVKPQKPQAHTVLPSPAPSDEPRQESIHIVDLEAEEEPQVVGEEQIAKQLQIQGQQSVQNQPRVAEVQQNHHDDPSPIRTTTIVETHDETEDARRHSLSGETLPTYQPSPFSINPQSDSPSVMLGVATGKRAIGDNLPSKKRLQNLGTTAPLNPNEPPSHSTVEATTATASATIFSPSEDEMRHFVGRIATRLEFVQRTQARRGPIEDGRLLLLRDACECYDHDYLLLHQLHCMRTRDPGCVRHFSTLGFGAQHLQGLHILDQLIRANSELVFDAVEWFSEFPLPNRVLFERYGAYQLSYGRVLKCLEKLAEFWQPLRKLCHERHYVPLVDELNAFDLKSVVLQRVISRAILRNIWLLPQDNCFHSTEKLFPINQQDVYQRDTQVSASPALKEGNKKAYNQTLIISYQKLWDQHQLHHSQFEHDSQARNSRSLPNALPPASSYRRQSEQGHTRIPQVRSVSGNHARLVDQTRRPHTINVNTQTDPRNGQISSASTPALPSSPFPGVHLSPVSWGNSLAGQHSSSTLPTPGAILPSNAEPTGDGLSPTSTGHLNIASTPTIVHDHPQNQYPRRVPSTSSMPGTLSPARPFESSTNNTQPETGFDSLLARALGWTEQSPRGSPAVVPSSSRDPHVDDMHRQRAGTRHQSRSHGQLPSQYPNANMANGQIETQTETQRREKQLPYTVPAQFLPPLGYSHDTNTHPTPLESALHQVHVRSPILKAINSEGDLDNTTKYFRFMWGLVVMPNRLHMQKRYVRWTFTVSKESVQLLARNLKESDGPPPTKYLKVGSRFCRIRCVQVSDIDATFTESDWAVADNAWPRSIAIILNGTALEIRRKLHHGKDLPIDVGQYIQEGQNTLSIATMWLPQEFKAAYAVGLETLQVTTDKKIKEDIQILAPSEAQQRIIERASSVDPDIQIIDPSIVLDITDPYTSSIFEVPVRGMSCRHNQCFDLYVFLQTRGSKTPTEPCGPDQFKCPLCGGDARPQSLVVDGFFKEVREELSRTGRLDARAIVLHESGDWQIKEVEETGESGDGLGTRFSRAEELLSARAGKAPIRRESEVIEIDDD